MWKYGDELLVEPPSVSVTSEADVVSSSRDNPKLKAYTFLIYLSEIFKEIRAIINTLLLSQLITQNCIL